MTHNNHKFDRKRGHDDEAHCFPMQVERIEKFPSSNRLILERGKSLLNFPQNVLKKIIRELFVRPTYIMPGIVREKAAFGEDPRLHYKYQWSEERQEQFETDCLPKSLGGKNIQIYWTAAPTEEEARLIAAGCNKLTTILQKGQEISGFIHNRKDWGVQVIHRSNLTVAEISGIAILRSCRKLWTLGTTVLYGENSFLFDTRGLSPFVEPQSVVVTRHLDHMPNQIPGRHRDDGTIPTERQVSLSIKHIFKHNQQKSKFILKDPLTRFFMKIGRRNASNITNIVIQGRWNWILGKWKSTGLSAVGLHDLIPIYTVILGEICKNIHTLTLHDDDQGNPQINKLGPPGIDRDQEISESVGNLVHGLPNLQKLQLGHYKYVPVGCGYDTGVSGNEIIPRLLPNDEWAKALKWIGFVEQRAKNPGTAETY